MAKELQCLKVAILATDDFEQAEPRASQNIRTGSSSRNSKRHSYPSNRMSTASWNSLFQTASGLSWLDKIRKLADLHRCPHQGREVRLASRIFRFGHGFWGPKGRSSTLRNHKPRS